MSSTQEKTVLEFGFMPGQKVADLGAGAGHYTLPLARVLGPGGRVYAVDIKEDVLERLYNLGLEQDLDNINIIVGDLESETGTGLVAGWVDGVVLASTLSQIGGKDKVVEESKRILKEGGKVCVVEWQGKFGKEECKTLFTNSGFNLQREFSVDAEHYGLIFQK